MSYTLDKSLAKTQTFEEADNQSKLWQSQTSQERLKASWYLTCQAFGLKYTTKHKLDRLVHSVRKHSNG